MPRTLSRRFSMILTLIVTSVCSLVGSITSRTSTSPTHPGASTASGSKVNGCPTTGAGIDMSISDGPNLDYEITEVQPRQFGAGLFLPKPQDGKIWDKRTKIMELSKRFLISQGLRLNVDFMFTVDFYSNFDAIVRFTPEHESAKTMLILYWSSLKEE